MFCMNSFFVNQIEEDETVGMCGTHRGNEKCIQNFSLETWEETNWTSRCRWEDNRFL
jgi:hypothetical protein